MTDLPDPALINTIVLRHPNGGLSILVGGVRMFGTAGISIDEDADGCFVHVVMPTACVRFGETVRVVQPEMPADGGNVVPITSKPQDVGPEAA